MWQFGSKSIVVRNRKKQRGCYAEHNAAAPNVCQLALSKPSMTIQPRSDYKITQAEHMNSPPFQNNSCSKYYKENKRKSKLFIRVFKVYWPAAVL